MRNRFLRGLSSALVLGALTALPGVSSAGVFIGVSVNVAPPPLPVYVQPACPEIGYLWVPGYWAWNDGAYYWVPGTWVLPPRVGLLWTPGYWGWNDGFYVWHAGYWAPHVGFYGGVHYGFGYDGDGFAGGYWRGGMFFYNRAVLHVGPRFVTNVYYHPVVERREYEHVSFNGGPRGIAARPTRGQLAVEHERHIAFTPVQQRQQRMAFADRSLRADYNHGRPPVAATARPVMFHGHGAVAARAAGGPFHRTADVHAARPMRADRPSWASGQPRADRPMERGAPPAARRNPGWPRPGAAQRPPQRFESRPSNGFQEHGARPMPRPMQRPMPRPMQRPMPEMMRRPQDRPPPQFHQAFRPRERAPMPMRQQRPAQQRRGAEPPHGRPPEHRGGRRDP